MIHNLNLRLGIVFHRKRKREQITWTKLVENSPIKRVFTEMQQSMQRSSVSISSMIVFTIS